MLVGCCSVIVSRLLCRWCISVSSLLLGGGCRMVSFLGLVLVSGRSWCVDISSFEWWLWVLICV